MKSGHTVVAVSLATALTMPAAASEFVVAPYLQSASPTGIWVLWETDIGEGSEVDFGMTEAMGQTAGGASRLGDDPSRIHSVELAGLTPGTTYFYRARTADAASDIGRFKTPPDIDAEGSFRLVAMSDMQRDRANPDKFAEIVNEGILGWAAERGEHPSDALAIALIPGDLVDSGWAYAEWEETFFGPGAGLFGSVPIYPTYGNHEGNSPFYAWYFHLPPNGMGDFEEHWYTIDYGNLRVVGLDSNPPYRNDTQLDWLDTQLTEACGMEHIDFVFAQLHHPHRSELWSPGEAEFSSEVVALLERFSTDCDKPSVHFYGHTHGYSRGQSLNDRHVWLNVATAGGNIDYWDENDTPDYPDVLVSQDEYGFVIVEVEAGADPAFRVSRIGRGDEGTPTANLVRDTLEVRRHGEPPTTPQRRGPLPDEPNPACLTLAVAPVEDPDGDEVVAVYWQISPLCSDFSSPVVDVYRNHKNEYEEVDLQLGDDLTDEEIRDLEPATEYCWRARARDASLMWSGWSTPEPFTTAGVPSAECTPAPDLVLPPKGSADDGCSMPSGSNASSRSWTRR